MNTPVLLPTILSLSFTCLFGAPNQGLVFDKNTSASEAPFDPALDVTRIGSSALRPEGQVNGNIARAAVYKVALSAEQIAALSRATSMKGKPAPGAIASWVFPFDKLAVAVRSVAGTAAKIHYAGKTVSLDLAPGKCVSLNGDLR